MLKKDTWWRHKRNGRLYHVVGLAAQKMSVRENPLCKNAPAVVVYRQGKDLYTRSQDNFLKRFDLIGTSPRKRVVFVRPLEDRSYDFYGTTRLFKSADWFEITQHQIKANGWLAITLGHGAYERWAPGSFKIVRWNDK